MEHVYVLCFRACKGKFYDGFMLNIAFTSIEKAEAFIRREHKNVKEIKPTHKIGVKAYDIRPHDKYYEDAEWVEICKYEVSS